MWQHKILAFKTAKLFTASSMSIKTLTRTHTHTLTHSVSKKTTTRSELHSNSGKTTRIMFVKNSIYMQRNNHNNCTHTDTYRAHIESYSIADIRTMDWQSNKHMRFHALFHSNQRFISTKFRAARQQQRLPRQGVGVTCVKSLSVASTCVCHN